MPHTKLFSSTLFMILFSFTNTYGQNTANASDIIERTIESIAENSDTEIDYTELAERFNYFLNNPINLNNANKEDLEQLYFLSEYQIQNLLEYRHTNGLIYSLYELRLLDGFNYSTLKKIAPFVSIKTDLKDDNKSYNRAKHLILLRTQRTLETEKGYKLRSKDKEISTLENKPQYLGKAWKYYSRYKYVSPKKNVNFGFTAENDAGEPFFKDNNPTGFDFYSIYAEYKGNGRIQQINIGDYHIKFGQGLSLWSGLASKKSTFTTQNAKRLQGVKSYHSTDENLFFRGGAININILKNAYLTTFVSSKRRDATIENDSTKNLTNSGLHRTHNEIAQKNKLDEKIWGSTLVFKFNKIEFGSSFIKSRYSPIVTGKINEITKFYDFSGKENYNISTYYETRYKKIHLYGEIAKSQSGGKALLQGLNLQAHSQLSLELIYRKYDKDYQAMYANSFGEQSKNQNEEGIYLGLEFHPLSRWTILVYYDLYESPWLKYRTSSPSTGRDYLFQIEFNPTNNVSVYFKYKDEKKIEDSNDEKIKTPINISKKQYRLHLSAQLNENWEIRNRIEISTFKKLDKEKGYLIYQDIIYKHNRLTSSIRYALFDTDSYNTRIYAYENDILYAFSIPPYFNKGSRFYLNFRYKFNRSTSLYIRYALTHYSNLTKISSGNSEISGNKKSEIKLLLKLSF